MRKTLLAILLACSIAPAIAQAPPPVPALQDLERRTPYAILNQAGPFNVGFPLYGDGTDYPNWVQVYLNGIAQVGNWTLTSPTGSLSLIARPITDAQITFATPQSGTLQIVGAQRPRRLSQFPENRGVAARDLNVSTTAAEAQLREAWDQINRVLRAPPGETFAVLPPAAGRAGFLQGYDQQGAPALYVPGGASAGPCSTAAPGLVPATGGSAGLFLAGDCTFKAPTASTGIVTSSYASGSAQQTTGTITSGTAALALAGAIDFANTQGILVVGAGTAFGLGQPTSLTVTPVGTPGAVTYTYQVATCDQSGGYGIPVSALTTTGAAQITADKSLTIAWSAPVGGQCFLIWRKIAAGSYAYFASTSNASFSDIGQPSEPLPYWVPNTPPVAAQADWLVTTITSGAGTASLTLGANASTSAAGAVVIHDDTAALNAWIAAINSACAPATVSTGTYRTSAALNSITCSGASVTGAPGSNFLPAGATNSSTVQSVLTVKGSSALPNLGSPLCLEGETQIGGFGLTAPGYVIISQLAPGGQSKYQHISSLSGSDFQNLDSPCPISFYDQVETITVGGTVTVGNTVSITATVNGVPTTVGYTVVGSDTLATIAHNLAYAINVNATLSGTSSPPLNAWDNTHFAGVPVAFVGWPHLSTTVSWSYTIGANTETVTFGTQAWSGMSLWTPLENVSVSGITGDGSNVVGRNGGGYGLLTLNTVAHSRVSQIVGSHFHTGWVLSMVDGFHNMASDVLAKTSGSDQSDAISFVGQTALTTRAIRANASSGFGIGYNGGGHVNASDTMIDGTVGGRGLKLSGLARGNFVNTISHNSIDTNIAITQGTWKVQFTNFSASGAKYGYSGNSVGLWFSDDFSRYNRFFGGTLDLNATFNLSLSVSDTQNVFCATQYGGAGNLQNLAGGANTFNCIAP